MFVKAVYSIISEEKTEHWSISSGPWAINYTDKEWKSGLLPGSRLFVYDTLATALKYHEWGDTSILPFMGVTFWECHVRKESKQFYVLKDPPPSIMRQYWQWYNDPVDRVDLGKLLRLPSIPWFYNYDSRIWPSGIYIAEQVKIHRMLDDEDYLFKDTPWELELDRARR